MVLTRTDGASVRRDPAVPSVWRCRPLGSSSALGVTELSGGGVPGTTRFKHQRREPTAGRGHVRRRDDSELVAVTVLSLRPLPLSPLRVDKHVATKVEVIRVRAFGWTSRPRPSPIPQPRLALSPIKAALTYRPARTVGVETRKSWPRLCGRSRTAGPGGVAAGCPNGEPPWLAPRPPRTDVNLDRVPLAGLTCLVTVGCQYELAEPKTDLGRHERPPRQPDRRCSSPSPGAGLPAIRLHHRRHTYVWVPPSRRRRGRDCLWAGRVHHRGSLWTATGT
jgi:hypothetical protein